MLLPRTGTVSYNGVSFNSRSRTRLEGKHEYDGADRTVVGMRYTLTVEGYVTPVDYGGGSVSSTDDDMDVIRQLLNKPGGALLIADCGCGNISVNVNTFPHDLRYGPKPRTISWVPVGSARACLFVWTCEFFIPDCTGANYFGILEWNYDHESSIDKYGCTKRVIRGHVVIPVRRYAPYSPLLRNDQNVDQLKEYIRPSLPLGFQREQEFHLSADRSKLNFTFTDTEIPSPNAYPPGIVKIDAEVTVSVVAQSEGKGFTRYAWIFTGQGEAAAGQSPDIIHDRLMFTMTYLLGVMRQRTQAQNMLVLPAMFKVSEKKFGFDGSLSAAFTIMSSQAAILPDILYLTGLYEPLPFTWDVWHASMELGNGPATVRGNRGLVYNTAADAIIDVCGGQFLPDAGGGAGSPFVRGGVGNALDPGDLTGVYLWWENWVDAESTSGLVYHVPLARGVEKVEETCHEPIDHWIMHGYALRVAQKAPIPNLVTVQGKPVKEIGKGESGSRIVQTVNGQPLYWTWWRRKYGTTRVAEFQGGQLPPTAPNPFLTNSQTNLKDDPPMDVNAD